MRILLIGALALTAVAAANAQVEITEIWAGGVAGAETTSDWFELTNYGADVSTTGWYYDDDSADPTKNDEILGLGTLSTGQSAIVLVSWEDDFTLAQDAIDAFTAVWNVNNSMDNVTIGYVVGGSGLGGGGDEVWVFDGNTVGAGVIDDEGYTTDTSEASFTALPTAPGMIIPSRRWVFMVPMSQPTRLLTMVLSVRASVRRVSSPSRPRSPC